ncbi:hypothetical protein MRX96_007396 [Rhipicephalus microplus]
MGKRTFTASHLNPREPPSSPTFRVPISRSPYPDFPSERPLNPPGRICSATAKKGAAFHLCAALREARGGCSPGAPRTARVSRRPAAGRFDHRAITAFPTALLSHCSPTYHPPIPFPARSSAPGVPPLVGLRRVASMSHDGKTDLQEYGGWWMRQKEVVEAARSLFPVL